MLSTAPRAAWTVSRSFTRELDTPAAARAFVAEELDAREDAVSSALRDDVALVVSELTTNAWPSRTATPCSR
jgi:hypothetical protein